MKQGKLFFIEMMLLGLFAACSQQPPSNDQKELVVESATLDTLPPQARQLPTPSPDTVKMEQQLQDTTQPKPTRSEVDRKRKRYIEYQPGKLEAKPISPNSGQNLEDEHGKRTVNPPTDAVGKK